jgi:NAD(P)H-hydrate epimerase
MFDKINSDLQELDENEIRIHTFQKVKGILKIFNPFSHKGNRGHAAIFAGSHGMMGAAILSTMAATKSGAGKVSVIIPERYFELIHISIPEALVISNVDEIEFEKFDSIGIGPGLGSEILTMPLVEKLFSSKNRLVLDADMLNFISINSSLLNRIPTDSILTPHLLEWKRLFGEAINDKTRILKTQEICRKYAINVLIKGHISVLVTSKGEVHFNANGNAGMAKGGSGDVLTGLIAGLLAQGYSQIDAGQLAMYIHGLSGDLAMKLHGENAMTATDEIHQFGQAFASLSQSYPQMLL